MSESINDRNKKAVKAGIGYTIGNILSKGLSFVAMPLFGRIMSVEDYGKYNTFTAYTSVLFVVAGLALHVSIKNANIDFLGRLKKYISSLTLIIFLNTLLLMVVGILCANRLESIGLLEKASLVVPIVLESFCMAMITYYNHVLAVDYRHKEYVVLSFIYAVMGITLSTVLIETIYSDECFMGRVVGMLVSGLLFTIYILYKIFKDARPKPNKEFWKYGLKISIPIVPHGISQMVLSLSDRVMITKYCGDAKAGLYGFAYNVGTIFQVVSTALDTAWSQWFFDRVENRETKSIRKVANMYAAVVAAGAVLLMTIAPELILFMGGDKYQESCSITFPIVVAMYYSFMCGFPSVIEYYHKKTWLIAVGTVSAAGANIILNLVMIPKYGYVAAAYTTVACYLIYYLIHVLFAKIVQGEFLYDMRIHMLCTVTVGVCGIGLVYLTEQTIVRWVMLVVELAICGIVMYKNKEKVLNVFKYKK